MGEPEGGLAVARLHVARASTLAEAGLFIASSLLLSHGVRRDTGAAVMVAGRWILVRGSAVRRLWPDAESAEGWVKAVLRGARLGAQVLGLDSWEPPRGGVCIEDGPRVRGLDSLVSARIAYYNVEPRGGCRLKAELPGPRFMKPALANIVWDRVEAGLKPFPS